MRSLPTKLAALAVVLAGAGLYSESAKAPWSPPPEPPGVEVLFLGDLMLDRNVARRAHSTSSGQAAELVAGMHELVQSADLVALNLEGTVTDNASIAQVNSKILRFTFNPVLTETILHALRADVVSLANNHALDFYPAGYAQTAANLDSFGVAYMGHPLNSQNLSTSIERGGITFCFVGYHDLFDNDLTALVAEITRIRPACDKVITMTHWGVEYEPLPAESQVSEAHALVDAGADLVVGGHPHVVQPYEIYKGRAIFYSLGNFVFDQDFSWETTHSLALQARFTERETTYTLVPLSIIESRPAPAVGEAYNRVIAAAGGLDTIVLP